MARTTAGRPIEIARPAAPVDEVEAAAVVAAAVEALVKVRVRLVDVELRIRLCCHALAGSLTS